MSTFLIVNLSDEDAAIIERALPLLNQHKATTHGDLDLDTLVALLLEDVVQAVRKPESWEGREMKSLLRAHGYNA